MSKKLFEKMLRDCDAGSYYKYAIRYPLIPKAGVTISQARKSLENRLLLVNPLPSITKSGNSQSPEGDVKLTQLGVELTQRVRNCQGGAPASPP